MNKNTYAPRPKVRPKNVILGMIKYAVIIIIFLFLLFPVYWMLVTSLKMNAESYRVVPTSISATLRYVMS